MNKKNIVKVIKILKEKSELSMLGSFSRNPPFYVLISTVLSARNKDEMTIRATKKLFSKYKTPKQIANAPLKKIEPLIKQSGFYKIKAKRIKEISNILSTVSIGSCGEKQQAVFWYILLTSHQYQWIHMFTE